PADQGAAFCWHRRGRGAAGRVCRHRQLVFPRRRAGRRLCLRLDRACSVRAQQAGNVWPPVLVALQRLSHAGAVSRRPPGETNIPTAVPMIDEAAASAEAKAVFDDIKQTRDTDYINNFWRVLASDPATLKRIWGGLKEVMAP